MPHSSSGIRWDISADTLNLWSRLIKDAQLIRDSHMDHVNNDDDDDDCDSNADNEYAVLKPVLTFGESATAPIPAELPRLIDNPSTLDISDAISDVLPLNNKQKRTVSVIFYHALRLQRKLAVEEEEQFFLHMGGPGGTGKSRIVDAARLGMKLLGREKELLVIAPTGRAASTIHTRLDIAVRNRRKRQPSSRVRSLWPNTKILIIGEISMVSSILLDTIDT